MPLHPQAQALLDQMAALAAGQPPPTLAQRRAGVGRASPTAIPLEPVAAVEDRRIDGPNGEVPIRIYRPEGASPFPALVYFHGGGWRMGSLDGWDPLCHYLANHGGCIVVSVDFRLAPEHKFPMGLEDAYAATRWVAEHGAEIGVDRGHVAVGGDSAGGNLAAVVPLLAKQRGGPRLVFQLLMSPVTGNNVD